MNKISIKLNGRELSDDASVVFGKGDDFAQINAEEFDNNEDGGYTLENAIVNVDIITDYELKMQAQKELSESLLDALSEKKELEEELDEIKQRYAKLVKIHSDLCKAIVYGGIGNADRN